MSWIAVGVAAVAVIGSQFLENEPGVPGFNKINPQGEQNKAIEGNLSALPKAQDLAGKVNEFNQAEMLKQIRNVLPNFDSLIGTNAANIGSQLKGEIPDDVAQNIYQSNVAKGLESGVGGGTQRTKNLTARDLGLTSLALKDKGFDSLNKWIGTARQQLSHPQMDVTSMFISPTTQLQFAVDERDKQFQRDMADSQVTSYYSWESRMGRGLSQAGSMVAGAAGGGMGGMMGGMGGGGGGGAPSTGAYTGSATYGGATAFCWVAREVYGDDNPKWREFRSWMLSKASTRRLMRYLEHGEKIAAWIRNRPDYRAKIERWMNSKILEVARG